MFCKWTPIEETADAMRRHCARLTDGELRTLSVHLDDKAAEVARGRWMTVSGWLPWGTFTEWRMRELLALSEVVTRAIIDRSSPGQETQATV